MRKIVFINRFFYPDHSATSQILADLAFALAGAAGYEIHVVTGRQAYDDPTVKWPSREVVNGVIVHRVWTTRFGRRFLPTRAFDYLSFYITAFACLLRLARPGTVIVAKTDPPLISVVAALAVKLRSAILVNWVQDMFPEVAVALGVGSSKGPLINLLRWSRNFSLRCARANVAIGQQMKRRLQLESVDHRSVRVIPNWADGASIRPVDHEANELRKSWGLCGKLVVGYSGNLGRGHEFDTLLEAAQSLSSNDDIRFVIIGAGAGLEKLKSEVRQRNLANIQFQPYQPRERLAESLSAVDLHLVSLRPQLEGLIVPSKFYGIAAAGRTTLFVGAESGEISGLIREHGSGFQVDPGDVQAMVDIILQLFLDRHRLTRTGMAARAAFEKAFSREAAVRGWRDLLAEC